MKVFTACSANSCANLKVAFSLRRNLVFRHRLPLVLAAITALVAGSCTREERIALGLEPDANSVSPKSVVAGSAATPIAVTGTNLNNSPVLLFDKMPLAITSATATEIDATVPASDLEQPGTHQLTVVAALPGGPLTSPPLTFVVTSGTTTGPALAISKMHNGNFTQGQIGATYTITISNTGTGPTDGSQVTVTDMIPSGLTITGMSGTAWGCTAPPNCMRTDVLAAGSSYPPITVVVDVATNAPSMVTNQVSVSGGGSAGATASDPTTINSPMAPQLALAASSMPATFVPSGTGSYVVIVSNAGNAPTSGTVTLTVTPSSALVPASLSGTGWTCNTTMLTCTINTPLTAGASYNPITFDVIIPASPPPTVMTSFTASGGGSSPVTTSVSNPT